MRRPFFHGCLIITSLSASFTFAQIAAPHGWTKADRPGFAVYAPTQVIGAVEFRLHRPETSSADVARWFDQRSTHLPAGYQLTRQGAASQSEHGALVRANMATYDGAPKIVVSMGCQARSGSKQYGELITDRNAELIKTHTEAAAEILADACTMTSPNQAVAGAAAPVARRSATGQQTAVPGDKLPSVEAVLYSWQQVYRVTGLKMEEDSWLLLKDGSYRPVPTVPLEGFDAARDKAQNPKLWGRWRKSGSGYQLASAESSSFRSPPHQTVRQPARDGERLSGTWGTASGGSIGTTGYWNFRKINFSRDGRFSHSNSGGMGGTLAQGSEQSVSSQVVYDDEGSASSTSAPNFGGGSSRKTGNTLADRSGTYRLSGYTLELRYDNGRVARHLFFTNADRKFIWFGGTDMMRE